ncbi:MAG: hypothetical protein A2020_08790 [Lentisphaerae bacterium GWF2_45_14]|nr:MAG: hypothetical protein A2020_08790 [Lentisphaerae bacterium GWF2_45_14]
MPKLLIIDDEEDIREMLQIMFTRAGYEAVTASNGAEAARLLEAGVKIDLIITDVVMPEVDGIATIIESKKKCPEMKIIAISGGGVIPPETYLEMAEKLGASRTFTKPLQIKEVLNAVKELLAR